MKLYKRFLSALLLSFCLCAVGFAQEEETEEEQEVKVPEFAMRQVVPRILTWYFKPRSKPKAIRLAERLIKKEWLPEIKNIEFELVSEEEIGQGGEMYFFKTLGFSNGKYEIGFGYGDPGCSTIGDMWHFRIVQERVRLWESGAFGSGCSSAASRAFLLE